MLENFLSIKKPKLSPIAVQASRAEETNVVVKFSVSGVFLSTSFVRIFILFLSGLFSKMLRYK